VSRDLLLLMEGEQRWCVIDERVVETLCQSCRMSRDLLLLMEGEQRSVSFICKVSRGGVPLTKE
jgi:hypothetical protein